MIENKLPCQFYNELKVKGFSLMFKSYTPICYNNNRKLHKYFFMPYTYNPFPELKTHRFNPIYLEQIPKERILNEEHTVEALKDSLFMIDREESLSRFVSLISNAYTNKLKKNIFINGPIGSGKTLFLRRGFYELMNLNKNFRQSVLNVEKKRILFCTYQTPITDKKPYNAFYKIFREIFEYLVLYYDEKSGIKNFNYFKINSIQPLQEDAEPNRLKSNNKKLFRNFKEEIKQIIIEEKCFSLIKYLEMILKTDLLKFFQETTRGGAHNQQLESLLTFRCISFINYILYKYLIIYYYYFLYCYTIFTLLLPLLELLLIILLIIL